MKPSEKPSDATVEAVRAFNRFYTRRIGLLDENHLQSDLSLAEVRVLYEIAYGEALSPSALAKSLALDAGYVSRKVAVLERRRLVTRAASPDDARRSVLGLTRDGKAAFAALQRATRAHLASLLADLSPAGGATLVGAMHEIERVLEPRHGTDHAVNFRDPCPGDLGWIVHRQAALYAAEYGWDWTYEGLIAGICSDFVKRFDPAAEHCWIAERGGAIVGSVFVVRKSARVAQLRLLYVEPSARGLGIGARLVDTCVAFATSRGYRRLVLWTNDVLVSARRIYESAGFALAGEQRHRSFGHDLVGQEWTLDLDVEVGIPAAGGRRVRRS